MYILGSSAALRAALILFQTLASHYRPQLTTCSHQQAPAAPKRFSIWVEISTPESMSEVPGTIGPPAGSRVSRGVFTSDWVSFLSLSLYIYITYVCTCTYT